MPYYNSYTPYSHLKDKCAPQSYCHPHSHRQPGCHPCGSPYYEHEHKQSCGSHCYEHKQSCGSCYKVGHKHSAPKKCCVPILAISETVNTQTETVNMCDDPCVQNLWDFQFNLDDSCGGVTGVDSNGGVSYAGPVGGVPNLENYLLVSSTDEKKVAVDPINFNETGFAISLWFKTSNLEQDARFISKTGALAGESHLIQSHVVSAQLSNQNLKFRLKLGADPNNGTTQWETTNDPISADTWYHVVFWYDGCSVKIFLNGEEQTLTETQIDGGNNASRAFEGLKGQAVFQGGQPVAIASQPTNVGMFSGFGWRAFDGCLDQIIVWRSPISTDIITALYNSDSGSNTVPLTEKVSCARFKSKCKPKCGNYLGGFVGNVCLQTCFTEATLSDILDQCGKVLLQIVKNDEVIETLVDEQTLNDWPGQVETLNDQLVQNDCVRKLTLRLSLDLTDSLVRVKDGASVCLTLQNSNSITTPDPYFVINGVTKLLPKYH